MEEEGRPKVTQRLLSNTSTTTTSSSLHIDAANISPTHTAPSSDTVPSRKAMPPSLSLATTPTAYELGDTPTTSTGTPSTPPTSYNASQSRLPTATATPKADVPETPMQPGDDMPKTYADAAAKNAEEAVASGPRREVLKKVPMTRPGELHSPKPCVVQAGDNQVSYAIFQRVAELYPASPNVRAAEAAKSTAVDEGWEEKEEARRERARAKEENDKKLRGQEAAARMLVFEPAKTGQSDAKRMTADESEDIGLLNARDFPKLGKRSGSSGSMASTPGQARPAQRVESEHSSRPGSAHASRLGSGHATRTGSSEAVTEIESPVGTAASPVIIRRPIGSRRPSFVALGGIAPRRSSTAGKEPDASVAAAAAKSDGDAATADVAAAARQSSELGASLRRKMRGEQGHLAGEGALLCGPMSYTAQTPGTEVDGVTPGSDRLDSSLTSDSDSPLHGSSDNTMPRTPLSSPLHDAAAAQAAGGGGARRARRRRARQAGQDTPEAGATEFSVAYSLDKAMDVIARVCAVDLGKAVYRRAGGDKLRVESKRDSGDAHLVAAVEMRAVTAGLTQVRVRRSKGDHGRTSLAAVWVLYDDVVTQLELLAHEAAASPGGPAAAKKV